MPKPENIRQLLKWIGNKQRMAPEIISYFPKDFKTYFEPFLGSGAVLGTLAPKQAVASDVLEHLIGIFQTLKTDPEEVLAWYTERWQAFQVNRSVYEEIKARFNARPNAADLLFLARSCYGGVIRFRKDGYMSTPIGIHNPISPDSMAARIDVWHHRIVGTTFTCRDFEEVLEEAGQDDLVYCDPPYSDTQTIVYGAQAFSLSRLCLVIERARDRGAHVALSMNGHKKSGNRKCDDLIPAGLFKRDIPINCGRSMLRRFQMTGQTLESEIVSDRLLLTW